MELRAYWKVIRRRWPLALVPALAALATALATYRPAPLVFSTSMRFTAAQSSPPSGESVGYDPNYYAWLTSEYIVSGLSGWIRTSSFATAVSQELSQRGLEAPPAAVQGALATDYSRSLLVVYLTWPSQDELRLLTETAAEVLQTRSAEAFPQFGGQPPEIVALDDPSTVAIGPVYPSLRSLVDFPLKFGLGLALGLALAFAAHALDPAIRDREEVEQLGLHVIGQIPKSSPPPN